MLKWRLDEDVTDEALIWRLCPGSLTDQSYDQQFTQK